VDGEQPKTRVEGKGEGPRVKGPRRRDRGVGSRASRLRLGTGGLWLLAMIVVVLALEIPTQAVPQAERPNIVFILSDDHRWDFMGSAGHPFIQTPNLDRLAAEGVHFTNAFVTTSLCSPSRASFLTGQYAHTHGVQNNLTPWRDENVTFLELLRQAGYDTAFIGKWHMPGRLPKLRGVDPFITFTVQEGQGRYWDCPLIVDGVETPTRKPYITEELTDRALDFIQKPRSRPFCLFLAHKAAHHEFSPPRDLARLYDDVSLNLPKEGVPWLTWTRGHIWAGTRGTLEGLVKDYSRVITAMDREIGRLLQGLDALGMVDQTVVVYAGDNGYFWGEHRLVDKRWAYEEAIRIPLIIRAPGRIPDPGRKAQQMVLNIDLAPSLLDLGGSTIPGNMEGRSFVPVLASPNAPGRKAWLYEYFKDFPYNVPEIRAVRTATHKYIEYGGRRRSELYDVAQDPKETRDLMGSEDGQRLQPELRKMLEALREGRGF
jgi:arylsulfatase A-like enzyme